MYSGIMDTRVLVDRNGLLHHNMVVNVAFRIDENDIPKCGFRSMESGGIPGVTISGNVRRISLAEKREGAVTVSGKDIS